MKNNTFSHLLTLYNLEMCNPPLTYGWPSVNKCVSPSYVIFLCEPPHWPGSNDSLKKPSVFNHQAEFNLGNTIFFFTEWKINDFNPRQGQATEAIVVCRTFPKTPWYHLHPPQFQKTMVTLLISTLGEFVSSCVRLFCDFLSDSQFPDKTISYTRM